MVERLAVVDVSPVNRSFDVTDATEWNMEHFFHAMLAVEFRQDANMSQCRKDADRQLARRIDDAGLRAWLLMNLAQDEGTGKFGWRANVAGILQGFKEHIGARFRCHE